MKVVRTSGRTRSIFGLACLVMCWLATAPRPSSAQPTVPEPAVRAAQHGDDVGAPRRASFGDVPLSFEANQGQACGSAQFLARGRGYGVFLRRDGAVLALARYRVPRASAEPETIPPAERTLVRMTLVGANPEPPVAGLEQRPGKVNYFRLGQRGFARVRSQRRGQRGHP